MDKVGALPSLWVELHWNILDDKFNNWNNIDGKGTKGANKLIDGI